MEIPPEYASPPSQVPAWVVTAEQRRRFDLCFAIGRAVCQRDDPLFVSQLFEGDIPTDVLTGDDQPGDAARR